jgi:hypothetical protein
MPRAAGAVHRPPAYAEMHSQSAPDSVWYVSNRHDRKTAGRAQTPPDHSWMSDQKPGVDLFPFPQRIRLWLMLVVAPALVVAIAPWVTGELSHPGLARIIGSTDVLIAGVILAIAGNYDLALAPLKLDINKLDIKHLRSRFMIPLGSLAACVPSGFSYVRVYHVTETTPDGGDLAFVIVSFTLTAYCGSLAAWKAAKG